MSSIDWPDWNILLRFDKSKLKWSKDGEGGLDYENEDDECFEDVSGGESNGDETRIWKIKVQGIDYFGHW